MPLAHELFPQHFKLVLTFIAFLRPPQVLSGLVRA